MLLEPKAINQALSLLRSSDLSLSSHRTIFDVISYLVDENIGVDIQTVSDELRRQKSLEAIGGMPYLFDLTSGVPRRFHVDAYARTIKDKALMRELQLIAESTLVETADQSLHAKQVLEQIESRLMQLSDGALSQGFLTAGEVIQSRYANIDDFFASGNRPGTLATGFADFDRMTSLLKPEELIIIAARPSMGKTAWALNIASNCALRSGLHVGVFSLEMSSESLLRRVLLAETRISKHKFDKKTLSKDERLRAIEVLERIMSSPLFIEDTAFTTMPEIRAKARRLKQDKGLDLLIIDYLQLIEPPKAENRVQEVTAISRGLKGLAKELGIPVICLSQLSRACEQRADKRPVLSDLRDSGSIEQDADIVAFIYRDEVYNAGNPETQNTAEIILAKQREGPIGTIEMIYLKEYVRFHDQAYRGEDGYGR